MIGVHYIKYVNDKGYVVKDEVAIDRFAVKETQHLNMNLVQAYSDWMGCNDVLRSRTHF